MIRTVLFALLTQAEHLAKAVGSADIANFVPESLEAVAHNTMWQEADPNMLTALKLLPSVSATKVEHQYARIDSYGDMKGTGFITESSVPTESHIESSRHTVWLKVSAEVTSVLLTASLQQTINVDGSSNPVDYEPRAARLRLLRKQNRNIYFSDTSKTRHTVQSALRFQGLMQQIREGTDGTVGTADPDGAHIINMRGQLLTPQTLRDNIARIIVLFGFPTAFIMDPTTNSNLEGIVDNAARYSLDGGNTMQAFTLGRQLAGFQSQGRIMWFHRDTDLEPKYSRPKYTATLEGGAPTTVPTVTATAIAGISTSDWDASSAGDIYWVVTEVVDEKESAGTRFPSGTGSVAVAAGERVRLILTPTNTQAETFKVYRGTGTGLATDAWFIFEVACSTTLGAAVTAYDDNLYRPNTSVAFGLNLDSNLVGAMHDANGTSVTGNYERVASNFSEYMGAAPGPRNTVAMASLGPKMMNLQLATIIPTVTRPLACMVGAPEVKNPMQNFALINIGRS